MGIRHFRHVIACDFEFTAPPGERPTPICLVARDLRTGNTWQCFGEDLLALPEAPFPTDEDAVLVAYYASAEAGCFLALGWPLPAYVLDLFTEFRTLHNGRPPGPGGAGLLGALAYHGLDSIDVVEKESMRALALRGGPYSAEERRALLDYCQTDVDALARLLPAMLPGLDLPRAILRGRYMVAAARMEHTGIPIDTATLATLRQHWDAIQDELIAVVDADYGVFEGRTFKASLFAEFLVRWNIPWPRLPSGSLDLRDDTFKDMARHYPRLQSLRELRSSLSQLRLADLAVGSDGRNRCLLSAFRARTGRNQPSNAKFIFGPAVWLRGLIRPKPGWGMAYIDWKQQEFGIAAALSGDERMQAAYQSGDPYLAFAKQAGAVPMDATKASHPREREQFKACVLAVQYGMGAESLALRIGQPVSRARELLALHRQTYRRFWTWSDSALDYAILHNRLWTTFGWTLHITADANHRSIQNFPMQANGAELLRLACCLATEDGIWVCAPVHDALLIEAPLDRLDEHIHRTQAAMAEASKVVLDGFLLATDATVVRHPDRYRDERGSAMWSQVWRIIGRLTANPPVQV